MSPTVRGARVLVTGATRGMGRLFAERAAAEGAAVLVLWGRDVDALQEVAAALARPGLRVRTDAVDLDDVAALDAAAHAVLADLGAVDVLVNNAGVITSSGYFWQQDPAEAAHTLRVNTLAPMRLAAHFLPAMIADAARPKRVLNVASAAGIVPNPRMSVYAASKAALLSWSDTLRLELEQAGHTHVRVTTFSPSYVSTGMFEGVRSVLLTPMLRPERAVDQAWRALLAGRAHVISPPTVHVARAARGLLPSRAWDRLAKAFGVHRSMEGFTGRPS
ncbi:SDR family NAD(P)-dependent oxidoreductase [Georgenia yuyongxinii]|uniref:SDR family NAD(P)-dependent oxidoreductase n=1 Tax=Georgenia yuyongxinii TaxID=2589797 RepID=A0A552WVB5_9MICO|nr:SDR family NAD(P)-dependent oxidoreductase [Georgenia yuyongxinii]TRW46742.1 SDR family NAD(P)-dependent oxidoreductase [Georgenia yuyongxinii]